MIELLRSPADPGATAIVSPTGTRTYGELRARAEAVAGGLRAGGITRFGIALDDVAEVIAALAGSSLVGAEGCTYPADPATHPTLVEQLHHDTVLRSDDEVAAVAIASAPETGAPPADRPLLVLTTGSTGAPKAARHDWNRVLRAAAHIAPAPEARWLLAYGLHQFAGLQIIVHVLASGGTLVVPASLKPFDGLAAVRAHEVTAISATPTWWRFLLAELRSTGGPAPDLRQITLGGEAAPDPLLAQLAATFPQAKVSHVYAATEIGATSSTRDGRAGLPLTVLDRPDDADVAMRVVDGELWVRSRVGMLGYHGEDPVDPDAWRATGDLVDVVDDRIVFRGRVAEVINVGGVKVPPLPVEQRVESVVGVAVARVFGRPNRMTGAIVAVEAVAEPGTDPDELTDAIREACADLPPAWRPRSVRLVDTITTVGGKRTRRHTDDG